MRDKKIIVAIVLGIRYMPGMPYVKNGVRGGNDRRSIGGKRVVGGSHGTYVLMMPAFYILDVELDGKQYEIRLATVFRQVLGIQKLTKKRRERIEATIPQTVRVQWQQSQRGTRYLTLTDTELLAWAQRVRAKK